MKNKFKGKTQREVYIRKMDYAITATEGAHALSLHLTILRKLEKFPLRNIKILKIRVFVLNWMLSLLLAKALQ